MFAFLLQRCDSSFLWKWICLVTVAFFVVGTTNEPLIGANVIYGPGLGTVTDIDGKYSISLDYGQYSIKVSYVGYEPVTQQVDINSAELLNNEGVPLSDSGDTF